MSPAPKDPPWLSVVGIGEDGVEALSPAARILIEEAEILIGGARHLALIPDSPTQAPTQDSRERIVWPSPLQNLLQRLPDMRGRRVCVLATGDPFCFGIATALVRRIPIAEMVIHPAPSSLSLACARLGWSAHGVALVTLHGRPMSLIEAHLQPGAHLLILSHDAATPHQLAAHITERGYGESRMWVLEHMGGDQERCLEGRAADWPHPPGQDLNVIALQLIAGPGAAPRPHTAGLEDAAFENDGQLTKREVRAATIAALAPHPRAVLWDIGAGSGSVAIEWLRAEPLAEAIAVEPRGDRRAIIARNATALGVPRLQILGGEAPAILTDLARPDAIFVGGGVSVPGVLEGCHAALGPGGRLVANAVTLEGEAALIANHAQHGGELVRIAVSRARPVGPFTGWHPLMPVTQWRWTTPHGTAS